MIKSIDFTAKNVKPFSAWIKKFVSIENSLLIELDESKKCFIAKSYNDTRSVVKYSTISFDDAGLTLKKESNEPQLIKFGIYNIQRLIKTFDHFSSDEFSFSVQYDESLNNGEKNLIGVAILLKNSSLKIKIDCTSLNIFEYISDNLFITKIAHLDPIVSFDLPISLINESNSLCDLDKEYEFLDFLILDNRILIRGKSFELDVEKTNKNEKSITTIYKNQFNKLDLENYIVDFGEDKLIFKSKDSDTTTVISRVEKDSKYEEPSTQF